MKNIFRLLVAALALGGWILAALCVHVIRIPDPNDATQSKFVLVPKQRLGVYDTYIDTRHWTAADVQSHGPLVQRMIDAGKANDLKFLVDPKSDKPIADQLVEEIVDDKTPVQPATTPATISSMHGGFPKK